jgi:hypothetical protein
VSGEGSERGESLFADRARPLGLRAAWVPNPGLKRSFLTIMQILHPAGIEQIATRQWRLKEKVSSAPIINNLQPDIGLEPIQRWTRGEQIRRSGQTRNSIGLRILGLRRAICVTIEGKMTSFYTTCIKGVTASYLGTELSDRPSVAEFEGRSTEASVVPACPMSFNRITLLVSDDTPIRASRQQRMAQALRWMCFAR